MFNNCFFPNLVRFKRSQKRHTVVHLLRHCAASRKVAGRIAGWVLGIFHLLNFSGRTMILGLNELLIDLSFGIQPAGA
jgi:hypothetical protein